MKTITPFANESDSVGLGDLTIENHEDRVALYGSIDLTRDQEGLAQARSLKTLLDRIVQTLASDKNLPAKLPPAERPEAVKNPFA